MIFRKSIYTAFETFPHFFSIKDKDGTIIAEKLNILEATSMLDELAPTPQRPEFKPIEIEGKPLSETVIEERR